MSKAVINQNLKLLEALQPSIDFLKYMKSQHLAQLANKAFFFVFNRGMILAREQQSIDFVGVVLEGKITISGSQTKKGPGYMIGSYGLFNLLQKHAESIIGDSEGILLALRMDEIPKFSEECRNTIISSCLEKMFIEFKNQTVEEGQWEEVPEKTAAKFYFRDFKELIENQIDQKQKQVLFTYFPWLKVKAKDLVIRNESSPYLLMVLKGELIIKGSQKKTLRTGDIYNREGFLLNYTTNEKIYCLSEEATILLINRKQFLNKFKSQTFFKFSHFLLRQQMNEHKYEVETFEKKKQKLQSKSAKDWSPFFKVTYEILPLNIPQGKGMQFDDKKAKQVKGQKMMGILFKNYAEEKKKLKTSSSANSKLEKLISMKTQKFEDGESAKQRELNDLKKNMESLQLKLKFYEDNYKSLKLELIEYKSKYEMIPVLKQISSLSESKKKSASLPDQANKVTLKQAFDEHMKANRINEVVAKCAYKWLWAVRRKKKGFGIKNDKKQQ